MSVSIPYSPPHGCAMPPTLRTLWGVTAQVLLAGESGLDSAALVRVIKDALPQAVPDFQPTTPGQCRRFTLAHPVSEVHQVDEVECAFRQEGEGDLHINLSRRFLDSMTDKIHQVAPEAMVFFAMVWLSHSAVCVQTDIRVGWCLPTSVRSQMEPQGYWGGDSATSVRGSSVPRSHLTPAQWRASLRPNHRHMALAKACLGGHLCTEVCDQVLPMMRARHLHQVFPAVQFATAPPESRL